MLVAYIKGAKILEFHFTDTRKGKVFRDHLISLTKNEVKNLSSKFKRVKKKLLGKVKKIFYQMRKNLGILKALEGQFTLIKKLKKATLSQKQI